MRKLSKLGVKITKDETALIAQIYIYFLKLVNSVAVTAILAVYQLS